MVVFQWIKSAPLSARIGFLIVFVNVFAAVFAPYLAPYTETETVGKIWMSASPEHWLGTDYLGRDMYTRLLYGARNTIAIAFAASILSFVVGTMLGLLAAIFGGWVDMVLSRIVDILMAFPTLIFALIVLAVMGTSVFTLIFVIAIINLTRVYRLSRAVSMDINVVEFVEVARLRGENIWWIMRKEILPNAMPPLVAEFGLRFCFVFLFIAALSFLGLGIQPPYADWGGMVRQNASAISFGIFIPLIPAAAIALLTVGVNLIVDWFLHIASGLKD